MQLAPSLGTSEFPATETTHWAKVSMLCSLKNKYSTSIISGKTIFYTFEIIKHELCQKKLQ